MNAYYYDYRLRKSVLLGKRGFTYSTTSTGLSKPDWHILCSSMDVIVCYKCLRKQIGIGTVFTVGCPDACGR